MPALGNALAIPYLSAAGGGGTSTTWDTAFNSGRNTLSNGNLDVLGTGAFATTLATVGKSSGKWQFEVEILVASGGLPIAGIATKQNWATLVNYYLGRNDQSVADSIGAFFTVIYFNLLADVGNAAHGGNYAAGDVNTITVDLDAATPVISFYENGVFRVSRNLPTARTWYPGTSVSTGDKGRLRTVSLTYPVSGFTNWN